MGKVVKLNGSLGELNAALVAKADLIVYDYYDGGYDGQGYMIVKIGDNYYENDLSHCSCFGPIDGLAEDSPGVLININEFLNEEKTAFGCEQREKVRQYLKGIVSNGN